MMLSQRRCLHDRSVGHYTELLAIGDRIDPQVGRLMLALLSGSSVSASPLLIQVIINGPRALACPFRSVGHASGS